MNHEHFLGLEIRHYVKNTFSSYKKAKYKLLKLNIRVHREGRERRGGRRRRHGRERGAARAAVPVVHAARVHWVLPRLDGYILLL